MVKFDWGNIIRSPLVWIVGVLIFGGLMFWWGSSKGQEWADSKYLQEREERSQQIAVLESKEKELGKENEVLKTKYEAMAEAQRQADTAAEAKRLQDFQKLQDERARKGEEIENASPGENLQGLCADAKAAGLKLSFCQ